MPRCCTTLARSACASRCSSRRKNCTPRIWGWCVTATRSSGARRSGIESHVTHTYQFLQRIPWTRELQQIPLIAYGHHEKMDGRGYPRRITADGIPIQTRMMTISDIYDALTAQDRPYKRAVSIDRALDILTTEVNEGQLDPDLFKLFIDGKVFQRQIEDAAR